MVLWEWALDNDDEKESIETAPPAAAEVPHVLRLGAGTANAVHTTKALASNFASLRAAASFASCLLAALPANPSFRHTRRRSGGATLSAKAADAANIPSSLTTFFRLATSSLPFRVHRKYSLTVSVAALSALDRHRSSFSRTARCPRHDDVV